MNSITTKNMWPIIITTGIAIIALIVGAIIQYQDKIETEAEAKNIKDTAEARHKELKEANDKLETSLERTKNDLSQKSDDLAKANSDNLKLSEKINDDNQKVIEAQKESIKRIMGDGYAEIRMKVIDDNTIGFIIQSKSKYPIYDTNLIVMDINEVNKLTPLIDSAGNEYYNYSKIHPFLVFSETPFNLLAERLITLEFIKLPMPKEPKFLIFKLTCRHKTTQQYSIIWLDSNLSKVHHCYKIFEESESGYELIYENNMQGLPDSEWENNFPYHKPINFEF